MKPGLCQILMNIDIFMDGLLTTNLLAFSFIIFLLRTVIDLIRISGTHPTFYEYLNFSLFCSYKSCIQNT